MHAVHFDKTPTSALPHLNETFIMLSLSCHLCAVHAVLGIENTEQSEKNAFHLETACCIAAQAYLFTHLSAAVKGNCDAVSDSTGFINLGFYHWFSLSLSVPATISVPFFNGT